MTKIGLNLKVIYSEKATIWATDLSYVVMVKYAVEISKKFLAFSEYMNFIKSAELNFVNSHNVH